MSEFLRTSSRSWGAKREQRVYSPLTPQFLLFSVVFWILLTGLGCFHVYLRFLTRDLQLEQQILIKKQEQLHRQQLQLESQLAVARQQALQRMDEICANLGLVEIPQSERVEAQVPRAVIAKYLPATPVQENSSINVTQSAFAGQVEMPEIVRSVLSAFESNRAYAKTHTKENE